MAEARKDGKPPGPASDIGDLTSGMGAKRYRIYFAAADTWRRQESDFTH